MDKDAVIIDANTATEPDIPTSDPDISMTISSRIALEVPKLPASGPRKKATPESMLPPITLRTPNNSIIQRMTSPGTIGTIMPDTIGMYRYDRPAQFPQKPVFLEHPEPIDENSHKRAKRARCHSTILRDNSILSPITDGTNYQSVLEPVRGVDKTLWRETWEQCGKPGTLEDFARQQKVALLHSDIADGTSKSNYARPSQSPSLTFRLSAPAEDTHNLRLQAVDHSTEEYTKVRSSSAKQYTPYGHRR
jgi:hypothetical protein